MLGMSSEDACLLYRTAGYLLEKAVDANVARPATRCWRSEEECGVCFLCGALVPSDRISGLELLPRGEEHVRPPLPCRGLSHRLLPNFVDQDEAPEVPPRGVRQIGTRLRQEGGPALQSPLHEGRLHRTDPFRPCGPKRPTRSRRAPSPKAPQTQAASQGSGFSR